MTITKQSRPCQQSAWAWGWVKCVTSPCSWISTHIGGYSEYMKHTFKSSNVAGLVNCMLHISTYDILCIFLLLRNCSLSYCLPPVLHHLPLGREELQSINAGRALEVNTEVSFTIDWEVLPFFQSSVTLNVQFFLIKEHCVNEMTRATTFFQNSNDANDAIGELSRVAE